MGEGRTSVVARTRLRAAQWRRQRRSMSVATALFLVVGAVGVGTLQLGGAPEETLIAESGDDATTSTTDATSTTTEPAPTSTTTAVPELAPSSTTSAVPEPAPAPTTTTVPAPEPAPESEPPPAPAPAPVPGPEAEQPARFEITTRIEMLDATSPPPFTVDTTDPGVVVASEGGRHEVGFTGTDGTVFLDELHFQGDMRDGGGRLWTSGCAYRPDHPCLARPTDYYEPNPVDQGARSLYEVNMHTAELAPGTYVLDQPIAWAREPRKEQSDDPDGRVLLRITYEVRAFAGGAG